jgi:hypothetical protein
MEAPFKQTQQLSKIRNGVADCLSFSDNEHGHLMMSRGTQEHVDCTESNKLFREVNMDSNLTADEHQVNSDEFSSHLCDGINKDDDFTSVQGNPDGCSDKPTNNTKQDKHYTKEPIETLRDVLGTRQVFPFSLEIYFKDFSTHQNQSTTHTMSHELLRLSSLSTFSRTIDISMIRLARAGFYYIGQSSETKCFSCGISYKDWTSGDDPMTVHRRLSPSCDIVRHKRQHISSTIDNHEMERTPTQTYNQYQHSNDYATLEINVEKPKYPNFVQLQVRISSFQGWPTCLDQTPRDMAMAGFLFAGYPDYTRCFFCGGELRNWEPGEEPWVEHARWFPQCAFVKQNKGETFIHEVLKKQKERVSCYGQIVLCFISITSIRFSSLSHW